MFGDHGLCGLLEESAREKSPKCLDGNLGDLGEFCKGLFLAVFCAEPRLVERGKGTGGTTPGTKQKSGTMETTAYPLSRRAIFWTDMGAPGEDGGVWKGYLKNSR